MPPVVLDSPESRWECLSCDVTNVTKRRRTPALHACRGLRGLTIPMVPAGTRGENRSVEREDYIGKDVVQTDGEGRPVMSVLAVRDEGQDATIFAPMVRGEADS